MPLNLSPRDIVIVVQLLFIVGLYIAYRIQKGKREEMGRWLFETKQANQKILKDKEASFRASYDHIEKPHDEKHIEFLKSKEKAKLYDQFFRSIQ